MTPMTLDILLRTHGWRGRPIIDDGRVETLTLSDVVAVQALRLDANSLERIILTFKAVVCGCIMPQGAARSML
jgi:hypothetical protein